MTAFTVWKFASPDGAEHAVSILQQAESEGLVEILDHATVSWPEGEKKPKIKHGHEDTSRGVGWGAFWGFFLGALFAVPLLGVAAGAALGGASKALQNVGITEEDMKKIQSEITEGTSGLFVVTDKGNLDRLGERLRGMDMTLVQASMTDAERDILLEAFGR